LGGGRPGGADAALAQGDRRFAENQEKRFMAQKMSGLAGLGALVYSTETGRHCSVCALPLDACACKEGKAAGNPAGDGVARVRRESKGRGGKTVTTISGLAVPADQLRELAGALKRRCGTGGTLKAGVIEIQGEHVASLLEELSKRGYTAKRSGG
jgi:translation initiation factor 1